MRELSLHILDIAQNSIAAKASLLEILVEESPTQDLLTIQITDNGKGMPPQLVATVTDPFTTSRTTRKVGLGLPLFKAAAEACGGFFHIWSQEERGTQVKAAFQFSHIDRAPLGDMASTITSLVALNPEIDILYIHKYENRQVVLDTREIKSVLEVDTLTHPSVLAWMREYLQGGLETIKGEDDR
ncbi:MAG: sensor histidine kinase [Firmicutes bacterium]|nr:sensor histidine kinase [Bacillota bacterium]